MATVTTSIGVGTSHDENAAISGVSGAGPYTVTIAANSSVNGDALWDEHATPRKYLITAGGGTTSLTVRDTEGVGSAPDNSGTSLSAIKRYYGSIATWEADLDDTGLYVASDDAVGECYKDANFNESVTINGGRTVNLNSVTLTVPVAERHDGTAGSGMRIVYSTSRQQQIRPISAGTEYYWEWTEIDMGNQRFSGVDYWARDTGALRNNIVHAAESQFDDLQGVEIRVLENGVTAGILNNIVYDMDQDGTTTQTQGGIHADDAASNTVSLYVYNNTVYKFFLSNASNTTDAVGINVDDDTSEIIVKNNISMGTSTAGSGAAKDFDFPGTNPDSETNLSGDATADDAGGTHQISKTDTDQFEDVTAGMEDLHLKSGADAIDNGTNLGTTLGVQFDIDNRDRDTEGDTWDIGADELVAADTPAKELAWQMPRVDVAGGRQGAR
jgi:hypothetical protein